MLLDRRCTTLFAQASLDICLPIDASLVAEMTGMRHHTQLLLEMRSHYLFVQAGLEPLSS